MFWELIASSERGRVLLILEPINFSKRVNSSCYWLLRYLKEGPEPLRRRRVPCGRGYGVSLLVRLLPAHGESSHKRYASLFTVELILFRSERLGKWFHNREKIVLVVHLMHVQPYTRTCFRSIDGYLGLTTWSSLFCLRRINLK